MTIGQAVRRIQEILNGATDAPRLDAERIALHHLNQNEAAWLYTHSEEQVLEKIWLAMERDCERRKQGEPLAYILGYQEFYGRTFLVNPSVLIPRPATEELVTRALDEIKKIYQSKGQPIVVADLGTGSGCIAITLALEGGTMIKKIIATEISETAIQTAQRNVEKYKVEEKIDIRCGDFEQPIQPDKVDFIVSNPPYIPSPEVDEAMQSELVEERGLKYEPRLALDGGSDGQDFIKRMQALHKPAVVETTAGEIVKIN